MRLCKPLYATAAMVAPLNALAHEAAVHGPFSHDDEPLGWLAIAAVAAVMAVALRIKTATRG